MTGPIGSKGTHTRRRKGLALGSRPSSSKVTPLKSCGASLNKSQTEPDPSTDVKRSDKGSKGPATLTRARATHGDLPCPPRNMEPAQAHACSTSGRRQAAELRPFGEKDQDVHRPTQPRPLTSGGSGCQAPPRAGRLRGFNRALPQVSSILLQLQMRCVERVKPDERRD